MIDQVLSLYKADISDHKAKIKELSGEQKKLAQEQLKNLEAQNKGIDDHIKMLAKFGTIVGVVGGIAKFLWDDWKERAEIARLETAAFGVDLELMGKAALGTKTQVELLGDAAAFNNGVFVLTAQQMAIAERAMVALTRAGKDSEEVHKKILEAVTQLKTEGLRDLGVVVDKTGTSMDTAEGRFRLLANTMDALTGVAKSVKDTHRTMAEEVEHATARMADGWRNFKQEWITGQTANVAGVNVDIIAWATDGDYRSKVQSAVLESAAVARASGKSPEQYGKDWDLARSTAAKVAQDARAAASQYPKFGHELEMEPMNIGQLRSAAKAAADRRFEELKKLSNTVAKDMTDELLKQLEEEALDVGTLVGDLNGAVDSEFDRTFAREGNDLTYGDSVQGKADARRKSLLERTFGPIEEFDAYRAAFEMIQGVTTSAFDAWITGSMSAGTAAKKFFGDAIKGSATWLFGESVKYGLMALSSAIPGPFFSPTSASAYAATAVKYAAGAALLGGLAKGLGGGGGGGSGGSAGAGAAPTGNYGGGASGPTGNTYVVTYNDAFAEDSALMRSRSSKKMIDKVLGSPGVY